MAAGSGTNSDGERLTVDDMPSDAPGQQGTGPQPEWRFESVQVDVSNERLRELEDREAGASLDGGPSSHLPTMQVGRSATMPPGFPPGLDARNQSAQRSPARFLNRLKKGGKGTKKAPSQLPQPKLQKLMPQAPGAEPGMDLRDSAHADLAQQFQQPAKITGVEFSAKTVNLKQLDLTELIDFCSEHPEEGHVRWINIAGIQWEFLHALAMQYDLHPLAIEDTLTVPQRTKVDFYDDHLYMCVPVMFVTESDEEKGERIQRYATRRSMDQKPTVGPTTENPWGTFLEGQVDVQQCSIFLIGGRTLITIFMGDSTPVTGPLLSQLRQERTLVRNSGDASFLMYRILDNIADHIQPIADEYDAILDIYEQYIKTSGPTIGSTLNIYSQQRELIQINRTVAPLLALVSNLKEMDKQQSQMLSQRTGVYLNDIIDHLTTVSDMLREQADECRDLISLIFNITAHRQSMSTQTLAIVSVIFLPITFLAGVYGVNFTNVPELKWEFGYVYFWVMCILVTIVFAWALFKMGMFKTYS